MDKNASTVADYIADIPIEQKPHFEKLRSVIVQSIDKDFQECINYGMVGYVIPHSLFPDGYHCNPSLPLPFANLAAQKNSINLYHMGVYADTTLLQWFQAEYPKHCKTKLDMGKSCIRFKKYDDIPYSLISELFTKMTAKDWINLYVKSYKKK